MSVDLYIAFILACALLSITPGPNMSLVIANAAKDGARGALITVCGTALGNAVLVTLAVAGVMGTVTVFADWFDWLRWLGAVYLIWLGAMRLRALSQPPELDAPPAARGRWFLQGLSVSLSNPKVFLFLGALFPQFVYPGAPLSLNTQLVILGVTFAFITTAIDALLAFGVASTRTWLDAGRRRAVDGVSGVCLILGGVWLAMAGRAS
ncbi:MAG: LysE family translocator [Hyphomicrobiales bacterium]|nr:LysE family translocator [Hyphomicrobiales bacterium]